MLYSYNFIINEAIEYKNDSLNKERYHNPHIKVNELFWN